MRFVFFLIGWALLLPLHAARGAEDWLNQRVYLKVTAHPRLDRQVLEFNDVTVPAKITQVNGDWLWVGNAWVRSSEVIKEADGVTYYNRVRRESPDNVAALLYRGVAFRMKRDFANAIKDFTEVIRLDPSSASAYAERAATHDRLHQNDKAVADLNEAIRLAPDVAVFYNNRGCSTRGLRTYARAKADFDEAIRLDPKMALAYSNRGVNWMLQEEYDRAMADYNKALAIDPKMAYAYDGRGYVWSKRGHYKEALHDWDESIRLAPDEPGGYHNKARLYATCMSLGHRDGKLALENAKQACELDHWENWQYVSSLAAAYAELGQFDKAIEWQKKAIEMDIQPELSDEKHQTERLQAYEAGRPFSDPEIPEEAEETGP